MAKKLGLAALVLVLALGAAMWLARPSQTGGPMAALPPLAAGAQETAAPATAPVPAVPEMVLGNADAPVTLIEYGSYTCPHCAHFHETVFKPLKTDYIDTGKVRFVFREFYRNKYDLWASVVARCGGETRYFGINSMLFDQQKEWAASDDPAVVVENLRKIGRTAGMEDAQLNACLADTAMFQAMVDVFQKTSTADGVEGTPTLVIDGQKTDALDYDALKAAIDAKLAG